MSGIQASVVGNLIHLYRSSRDQDDEVRHSIQLLVKPRTGADHESFSLEQFKLPRGVNKSAYLEKVGHDLSIELTPWTSKEYGSGYFIKDVRDITDLGLPKRPVK